jgi:hypothetical protein
MKKALITGITGQDGSYLAELLLDKNYVVHGIIRRISHPNTENLEAVLDKITLHHADMTDGVSIHNVISEVNPDEIYNLAGMSQVRVSYDIPVNTFDINTLGLLRIIEAIRNLKLDCKLYQACYSDDTNIVTPNGIKKYNEINIGDSVYTVNKDTRQLEIKPIIKKIDYKYDGIMYSFKNRRIDCLVTPNHQMLFEDDDNNLFYKCANEIYSVLKYDKGSHISCVNPLWNGIRQETIDFQEINDSAHYNVNKNILKEMVLNDLLYL